MCSAPLEVVRFVDIQVFSFHGANRSDMDCVELQGSLFADYQEWHIQAAKL